MVVARRSPPPKPREMGEWGRWAGKPGGGMTLWTLGERGAGITVSGAVAREWRAGADRVWPGNGGWEGRGRSRVHRWTPSLSSYEVVEIYMGYWVSLSHTWKRIGKKTTTT
jgi:hypothetical protein